MKYPTIRVVDDTPDASDLVVVESDIVAPDIQNQCAQCGLGRDVVNVKYSNRYITLRMLEKSTLKGKGLLLAPEYSWHIVHDPAAKDGFPVLIATRK